MVVTGNKIAVLGDLHYETSQDELFRSARSQILEHSPDAIFQLGDHGGYSHCGTRLSFVEGREFLAGFGRPFHTLIGNHDLEGPEYATDAQSVAAWCQVFDRTLPYCTVDLGDALAICLSSVRFRGNPACHHEVYLGEKQVAWLRSTLLANRRRPTFVFSHAPILGSGVRVLQNLHLKCPNAWLHHTDRPEQFIHLVRDNPQIKLWFSAHIHLGHSGADTISQVGGCTFVHTGVVGAVTRDGCRHTRLVEFNASGFRLSTIDHAAGELIDDLEHDYATRASQRLCSWRVSDAPGHFAPAPCPTGRDVLQHGRSVFAVYRGMLVE
ncbi:MAG: metallophosphoesterase, partial [Planctomycetes bacterium]|nr:metallophosphoesterase [Planctomycetota bacterium]